MLDLEQEMSRCRVCPRKCGADREHGKTGYCKAPSGVAAARAALHFWEEPCISGTTGSGTVFFSGCNLRCVYCQNHHIAEMESGKVISIGRLSDIFLELQAQNANNINLVTPSHYVLQMPAVFPVAAEIWISGKITIKIRYIYPDFRQYFFMKPPKKVRKEDAR